MNYPFVKNFSTGFDFKDKLKYKVLNLYSRDYLDTKTITVGNTQNRTDLESNTLARWAG